MGYWKKNKNLFPNHLYWHLMASLTLSSWNHRPPRKVFRCRNTWKSLGAKSELKGGMIELFPAKCRDEILRYGGRVWADIVMKHHNIMSERSKALACHFFLCSSVSNFGTQHEHNFRKRSLADTIWWRSDRKIFGKCRASDEMVNRLFSWIFSSTDHTKSSLTTDSRPLRRSSCAFLRPSLKCLNHIHTIESLMACYPYT
jgi:hypothetical protein